MLPVAHPAVITAKPAQKAKYRYLNKLKINNTHPLHIFLRQGNFRNVVKLVLVQQNHGIIQQF